MIKGVIRFFIEIESIEAIYQRFMAASVAFCYAPLSCPGTRKAAYHRNPYGNALEFAEMMR